MDSLINAAARALAVGAPLDALNLVALRDDAAALALRGIAMAQLGDLKRARALLRQAQRGFGGGETVARARCVVAEAEIALAARDLNGPDKALAAAQVVLAARGDAANAAYAEQLAIRRLLLIGHVDEAERRLARLDPAALPPAARVLHALIDAGIATRRLNAKTARVALAEAARAARGARIAALSAEVDRALRQMDEPAALLIAQGTERLLTLDDVESLLASNRLVVDACRHAVRRGKVMAPLAGRPVLFALARALGEAWPEDVPREFLLARAFGARYADESHRARLRVEIGRLRSALKPLADVHATPRGFVLKPRGKADISVLARVIEEEHAGVLALLADGEAWSSSALTLALGVGQRTVQRALDELAGAGKVESIGRGRARRWMTPLPIGTFTTALLLPAPLSGG
jgi:hypothetical protein